jgi:hypothetical protein
MMQTLRLTVFTLVLLALASVGAHAQAVVIAGQSTMGFDHVAADTTGYELCVDTLDIGACQPITVQPAPSGDTLRLYTFTLPSGITRGTRVLRVRPLWAGGRGAAGDVATFRAVVEPGPAGPVRADPVPGGR